MSINDDIRVIVREEIAAAVAEIKATMGAPHRVELLTYDQAAELVGVGVSTIKQWVKDAVLPVYGAASSRRVRPVEVVAVFKRIEPAKSEDRPENVTKILATLPLRRAR